MNTEPMVFLLHYNKIGIKQYKKSIAPIILDTEKFTVAAEWRKPKTPEIGNWLSRVLEVRKQERMFAIDMNHL